MSTKYQLGDIECSAEPRDDGRYHGRVFVRRSIINGRPEHNHLFPEADATEEEALRRAMNYANQHFPPK